MAPGHLVGGSQVRRLYVHCHWRQFGGVRGEWVEARSVERGRGVSRELRGFMGCITAKSTHDLI